MAAVNMELSPDEVIQRTAILRRFRELLRAQRDRFGTYLDVLEKQKDVIEKGSADSLIRHVELEEKLVADIFSIQKVIIPLDELYRSTQKGASAPETSVLEGNDSIHDLKSALDGLKTEAVSRSNRNRNLLSKRMEELRSELKNLRTNPYAHRQAVLSGSETSSFLNLQG